MKNTKPKNLCLWILICVFVVSALSHTLVHAAQTIPGVQRLEEGIAAYEHGEYDDAIFKLEMAVYQIPEEDNENLWDAHFYLGLSYCIRGDEGKARKEFNEANKTIKNRLPDSDIHSPKVVKLFKAAKEDNTYVIPITKLRSTPKENLSLESVNAMLRDKGFYDSYRNKSASGFQNDYTLQNDGKVVYDRASGLMWQQSGSDQFMSYESVNVYVKELNRERFAGYNDWRLPTLEEAMSLIAPTEKNADLHIDPVFDSKQRWIWTSDLRRASKGSGWLFFMRSASSVWVVDFENGACYSTVFDSNVHVRAVR